MSQEVDIARAMKDKDYYNGLSKEQRALVPKNPAGEVELSDEALDAVAGGAQQTGTGAENCFCVLTRTADSTGGHCDCHCDVEMET